MHIFKMFTRFLPERPEIVRELSKGLHQLKMYSTKWKELKTHKLLSWGIHIIFTVSLLIGLKCLLFNSASVEDKKYEYLKKVEEFWKAYRSNSQESPRFIWMIRHSLVPPSVEEYTLAEPHPAEPHLLERDVRNISNRTSGGIFVEVGAGDGEHGSPTLRLEMENKWYGMLIEANPDLWDLIEMKNRKAYLSPTCVGIYNYSYTGRLSLEGRKSRLITSKSPKDDFVDVSCYPLYTHLLAFGTTLIDFLAININGKEAKVLQTLQWDKVDIKMIAVTSPNEKEQRKVEELLSTVGFKLYNHYSYKGEELNLFVK